MALDSLAWQSLYDRRGARKYLTWEERLRFLAVCETLDPETRLFALLMGHTGCRVSEALKLTPHQLDAGLICVVFSTLKRRRTHFRAVPVPEWLMRQLVAHTWAMSRDARIWSWSRQTGWSRIKATMRAAGIAGVHATPKGLRHGFGIACAKHNVPLSSIRTWMGHASVETTLIYLEATGEEERSFARRLWQH